MENKKLIAPDPNSAYGDTPLLPAKPLLQTVNLNKHYRTGEQDLHVLRNIDLQITSGQCLAILGRSGSGKSTLLHLLAGLDRPNSGEVFFKDKNIFSLRPGAVDRYRNKHIGFVFQFYHLLPELNALDNVMVGAMIKHSLFRWPHHRTAVTAKAKQLLDQVGLSGRMKHKPSKLSGGERQRVAIARALINDPQVLLADEPTGNLDLETSASVMQLFKQLQDSGQTIVMVTHDQAIATTASRTLHLIDGKLEA